MINGQSARQPLFDPPCVFALTLWVRKYPSNSIAMSNTSRCFPSREDQCYHCWLALNRTDRLIRFCPTRSWHKVFVDSFYGCFSVGSSWTCGIDSGRAIEAAGTTWRAVSIFFHFRSCPYRQVQRLLQRSLCRCVNEHVDDNTAQQDRCRRQPIDPFQTVAVFVTPQSIVFAAAPRTPFCFVSQSCHHTHIFRIDCY